MKTTSETDWDRIDSMRDEDIDFSDSPEMTDEQFKRARLRMPDGTIAVRLRLSREAEKFFYDRDGEGTPDERMAAALEAYAAAQTEPVSV